MSNSFEDSSFGIQLPSMTICYRAYEDYTTAPKMDETVTFKEFMETSKSVKDMIVKAELYVYGPNERKRQKFDFSETKSVLNHEIKAPTTNVNIHTLQRL